MNLFYLHIWETAPARVVSLYSLYMLMGSVLDKYLRTIPKFFTTDGFFSKTYIHSGLFIVLRNHGNEWTVTYLWDWDDLSLNLSDFVLSLHVVPELRLCEDTVLSEYSHSVQSGIWVLLTWEASSDHEKLSDLNSRDVSFKFKNTFDCIDSTPTPLTISLLSINEIINHSHRYLIPYRTVID